MKTLFAIFLLIFSVAAQGATYWVGTTGNDTTGDGTDGNSYATIARGLTAANAGDTVMVKSGRYEQRLTVNKAGTPANPITISAQVLAVVGATTNTSCRGFVCSVATSNVIIRGFEVTSIGSGNQRGIGLHNSSRVTVEQCYIHELECDAYSGDGIGMHEAMMATNAVIRSNILYKVEGTGISLVGNVCLVEGNEVSRGRERRTDGTSIGMDADAGRCIGQNNVWTNNYFHDYWFSEQGYAPLTGPHMDAMMLFTLGSGVMCSNNLFVANIFKNFDDQCLNTSDSHDATPRLTHIKFHNNIIWNMGGGGWGNGLPGYFINIYDAPNSEFINNTIIRYGTDGQGSNYLSYPMNFAHGPKQGCTNTIVKNNLFYGFGTGVNSRPVFDAESARGSVVDYNLWSSSVTRSTTPWDDNSVFNADPVFVNVGTDWRPQGTSPAIGVAEVLGAFLTTDKSGTTRGAQWDIGAYEYGSGAPPEDPPQTPTPGTIRAGSVRTGRLSVR
jgi:hypothetical protein